jgi:hypothetical protein
MGRCRVDERCCRGRSICAGAWLFGSRACSDRMGRRRKRRTPSWVIPCGALARRIEGCLQPPGNTPQPPSTNVVPAHDQHPHEIALNGLAFVAPGQEPPRPYPRLRHAKRLPSPARPAVGNSDRSIAGEGRGWGDNELSWSRLRVVRREARLRKAPHPAFGHLPPGGEGSDASRVRTEAISPLLRDRLWGTATAQSRGRGGVGGQQVTVTGRETAGNQLRTHVRSPRPAQSAPKERARTPCPSPGHLFRPH